MLISEEYRKLNAKAHERSGWGSNGGSKIKYVDFDANRLGARSILDYGCGKGSLKKAAIELGLPYDMYEYDPAIAGKDTEPEPADYIACIDVLEHVEPDNIDSVLWHIHSLMRLGGFLHPCFVPAHAVLADGRNAHLIQQPAEWWEAKVSEHFTIVGECYRSKAHVGFYVRPLTNSR